MTFRRIRRTVAVLTAVVATAMLWPASLGGRTTYVSTRGSSMEPAFTSGDLAVVRPAASYSVGDVVAYRSDLLDTVVLHRIIDVAGDRFALKGDNNSFVDGDRPTRRSVIGKLVVRVPRGGVPTAVLRAATPLAVAVLALLATSLAAVRRRARGGQDPMTTRPYARRAPVRRWWNVAATAGALGFGTAVLGAFAFTQPTTVQRTESIPFAHEGAFSYRADAPAGPVYDRALETGDPVYLQLVKSVDVTFEYRLDSGDHRDIRALAGDLTFEAELANDRGWRHRVPLAAPSSFDGSSARTTARVDIEAFESLIAEVEEATGVDSGEYSLALAPRVAVTGAVDGGALSDTFAPRVEFRLDAKQLRLVDPQPAGVDANIVVTEDGAIASDRARATTLSVAGIELAIAKLRVGAVVVGLLCVVVGASATVVLRRRLFDEFARVELRHRHRLIAVADTVTEGVKLTADVASVDDLVRIAEQHDTFVLHGRTTAGDYYFVVATEHLLYRYHAADAYRAA